MYIICILLQKFLTVLNNIILLCTIQLKILKLLCYFSDYDFTLFIFIISQKTKGLSQKENFLKNVKIIFFYFVFLFFYNSKLYFILKINTFFAK